MKKVIAISSILLGVVFLAGCGSQAVRDTGHDSGAIMINDIKQAQEYRKVLPDVFGLKESEMSIDPGAGFTDVTITKSVSEAEKTRILEQVKVLNDGNPTLSPIKVTFK